MNKNFIKNIFTVCSIAWGFQPGITYGMEAITCSITWGLQPDIICGMEINDAHTNKEDQKFEYFGELPEELQYHVISFLPYEDRKALQLVSQHLSKLLITVNSKNLLPSDSSCEYTKMIQDKLSENLKAWEVILDIDPIGRDLERWKSRDYNSNSITNEDMEIIISPILKCMPNLSAFSIFFNLFPLENITDQCLGGIIQSCPNLTYLNINKCCMLTDNEITQLRQLPKLISLKLKDITDQSLGQIIQSCPNLTYLNLTKCDRLTDNGITQLRQLPKLTSLDLGFIDTITGATLAALPANLTSLSLRDCDGIKNKSFNNLTHLTNLTTLALWNPMITDGFGFLCSLPLSLNTLKYGRIRPFFDSEIDTQSLIPFLGNLPNLRSLDLSGCEEVTYTELMSVKNKLLKLTFLNLKECTNITNEDIKALRQALPNTNIDFKFKARSLRYASEYYTIRK